MIGPDQLDNYFKSAKRDINVFVINNTLHNMQIIYAISFVPLLPAEKMILDSTTEFQSDLSIS